MGKKSRKANKKTTGGNGASGGKTKSSSSKAQSTSNSKTDIDIDKKCDTRMAELVYAEKKGAAMKTRLRFSVGDRVQCSMHTQSDDDIFDMDFSSLSITDLLSKAVMGQGPFEMEWKHGTVVQRWYCNPGEKDKVFPYQIRLDGDDSLIYAVSRFLYSSLCYVY